MTKNLLALIAMAFGLQAGADILIGDVDGKPLQVEIRELRGKKAHTNMDIFARASITRDGKGFNIFCTRAIYLNRASQAAATSRASILTCAEVVSTVSDDDNEGLVFDIAYDFGTGKEPSFEIRAIDYSGDGTFLGKHMEVLLGDQWSDKRRNPAPIALVSEKTAVEGFSQGVLLLESLENLVGTEYPAQVHGQTIWVPVNGFTARIENSMEVSISSILDESKGSLPEPYPVVLSLFKKSGDPDSGYRTAESLEQTVETSLGLR